MKLTIRKLKLLRACSKSVDWYKKQDTTDFFEILIKLMSEKEQKIIMVNYNKNSLNWANWIIVRMMTYKQYLSYAVYAAEQVIEIYEKKYPNDNRLRLAIKAVIKCINNPSLKNKNIAAAAADAVADAVAYAADERSKIIIKIIKYGIGLFNEKNKASSK